MSNSKITLLVADADNHYLIGFCNYVKKFAREQFNIIALNEESEIKVYIKESQVMPDIILTGKCYYDMFKKYEKTVPVMLLQDDKFYDAEAEHSGNYTMIDKYQSGEAILSEILDVYAGRLNYHLKKVNKNNQKSNNCHTICVYSPQGGAGKTTISVSLANQLGLMGYTVFYLNIESICSTGSFFDTSSNYNFSHVIYYLKSNREALHFKIRLIKKVDSTGKISYFPPPINPLEMEDLSSDDLDFLIKTLKETSEYDFIIVDMSSLWNKLNTSVLESCDQRIVILTEDPILQHKYKCVMDSIRSLPGNKKLTEGNGLILIKNKCGTKTDKDELWTSNNLNSRFNIPDFNHLLAEADGYVSVSFNLYFNHEINLLAKEILEWKNYVPLSVS